VLQLQRARLRYDYTHRIVIKLQTGSPMKARVTVTLKSGVLDPQGQAIVGSLGSLGFLGVESVRQGKVFDIELAGTERAAAELTLGSICQKLLANTVIENYSIEILH
jgi:phosphoribosylformylglycinamidine synthase PurS subunit